VLCLNKAYPGMWIGHGGQLLGLLLFLDLIPMEFVMWEHLKGYVYTVHAKTIDLMARLDTGVTVVSVNVFQCL